MKVFGLLEKTINKTSTVLQMLSNLMIVIMMLIISADVLMRTVTNKPIVGTFELVSTSSALLVFLALSNTHKYNEHISIGFIIDNFPERPKKYSEFVIEMFNFAVTLVIAIQMYLYGLRQLERNLTTSDLGLPNYIFIIIGAFGAFIFSLTALVKGINILRMKGENR